MSFSGFTLHIEHSPCLKSTRQANWIYSKPINSSQESVESSPSQVMLLDNLCLQWCFSGNLHITYVVDLHRNE